jgi:uncharacterized protein (DUF58 family)
MTTFLRQKRPFKLTKGGWVFILYTIGVGAGAINTGNNLLYLVFGLFLGLMLASGVLSDLTLWGLKADVLPPPHARVGEPLLVSVNISNSKTWFPSLGVRIELDGDLNGQPVILMGFCPALKPLHSEGCLPLMRPLMRGVLKLSAVRFTTRFPFGLLEKKWTLPFLNPVEIYVLPSLWKRDPDLPPSVLGDIAEQDASQRKGEGATLFGLREYKPGDHPKRIHWKASAKRTFFDSASPSDGWMVREMEDESQRSLELLWPQGKNTRPDPEFEQFLSYTASLIACLEGRKWNVSLVGRDSASSWRMEPDHIPRFLALAKSDFSLPFNLPRTDRPIRASADLWESFQNLRGREVRI